MRRVWLLLIVALGVGLAAGRTIRAEDEPLFISTTVREAPERLDSLHTYEVFFSLHPKELDRLSNVRILGVRNFGAKAFLRFETLLNNQTEEGLLDLDHVTAIFPTTKRLITTPDVLVDRQPFTEEVKEIRSETVREVLREIQPKP